MPPRGRQGISGSCARDDGSVFSIASLQSASAHNDKGEVEHLSMRCTILKKEPFHTGVIINFHPALSMVEIVTRFIKAKSPHGNAVVNARKVTIEEAQ